MNKMSSIAVDAEETAAPPAADRRLGRLALMFSVPAILLAAGFYFWLTSGRTVSTDNAQVNAHVVEVSAEVGGKIVDVHVGENQNVHRGDLLFRIDPAPYRIALMQADAAVGNAELTVAQLQEHLPRQAGRHAEERLRRQPRARPPSAASRSCWPGASPPAPITTRPRRVSPRRSRSRRRHRPRPNRPARCWARRRPAAIPRSRPRSPHATRLSSTCPAPKSAPLSTAWVSQADKLQPGTMVIPMLSMANIVSGQGYWIEANFKETQLDKLRVGQRADIELDAVPGRTLKGHVIGINAGTGSQFSLLPAQNATGNWVKVTQRVPVRIQIDEKLDRPLVAGWSAHVTVHVTD